MATVTSVRPSPRFGALITKGESVIDFSEKSKLSESLINGGFFVLKPEVIDLISGDKTTWEQEPLIHLAKSKELQHFYHNGFWQPMDTLREKTDLEKLWVNDAAPWKVW
jgi:glucose-1-phosphate cytidylyltransferase